MHVLFQPPDIMSSTTIVQTEMSDCKVDTYSCKPAIDDQDNMFSDTLPTMTPKTLQTAALQHGGYSTPALNSTLYLHYRGYLRIENRPPYANLTALWLDSNGFHTIENLNHLTKLRCLFLQRNLLTKIENIDGLRSLVQLDLSENRIGVI